MDIDFAGLPSSEIYQCMTQTLIPRPVAWVLSENAAGDYNLAPYSYFTIVSGTPPLVMISVNAKSDGAYKDTRVNIEARGHFVINLAHQQLAKAMNETARGRPYGDSEVSRGALSTTPFSGFVLPRLTQCRVAYACRLYELKEIGPHRQGLIFGEVERVHIADGAIVGNTDGRLKVDASRLDPIARLGGEEYSSLGEIMTIPRPS